MKWLLIVVLVCSVLVSGCSSNKTGYECFACEEQVSGEARTCPHCGQPFEFRSPMYVKPDGPDIAVPGAAPEDFDGASQAADEDDEWE